MISMIVRWYNLRVGRKIEKDSVWLHENRKEKVLVKNSIDGRVYYTTLNNRYNFDYTMDACKFKSIFKKVL